VKKNGVTVYRNKRSSITDIAAEGVVPTSPEQVQRALVDYRRHAGRIARVAESRILKRKNETLLVYQRLDLPLLSDRDFTLSVRWGRDEDRTHWVDFHTVPRGPRCRRGVVRITHHTGSWELKPIRGGGATLARYQLSIDLAGYLPRWLARSNAGKEVPALFKAICRLAMGKDKKRCDAR
jgi:hypothetical protein